MQVLCGWGCSDCVTAAIVCVLHTTSSLTTPHITWQALTPRASDPSAKKKKGRPSTMAKRPETKETSADKAMPLEEKSKEPIIPSAVMKLSQQIEVGSMHEWVTCMDTWTCRV